MLRNLLVGSSLLLLVAVGVLLLFVTGRAAEHTDEASERFDATTELPLLSDEPDPDGWSAQRGWDYRTVWNWIVDGFDPTPVPPAIYHELGGMPELEMAA